MPQCLISFGANLGSRDSSIATALRWIESAPSVENFRTSRLFESPAIGGPSGQSSFLNGVAAFDTTSRAREVLEWLQDLETRLGRQRGERWAARSIDLDVVLHGTLIGGATDLTVPHPRYTARRFVLRPACDVAPHFRDPRFGWTIQQLSDHLDLGNASMALSGGDECLRRELGQRLETEHGIRVFHSAPMPRPMTLVGTAPSPDQVVGCPPQTTIKVDDDSPWMSTFVPAMSVVADETASQACIPRLIARVQRMKVEERWPAPHRMWPSSLNWPEYRLEVDDVAWAAKEISSALASMRCSLEPMADDDQWWRKK